MKERERTNGLGIWNVENFIPRKANDLNLTLGGLYLHNLGRYYKLVVVDLIIRSHLSFFSLLEGHGRGR